MIFDGLVKNVNKVSKFLIQYTRRARIAQSSALSIVADEPESPLRDISQGEACPTDSGFIADQDRETIAKSSTLPRDSAPRVTSPAAAEGRDRNNQEAAAERASDDTEEMATVLTSMDAATVLESRAAEVPTGSGSIPTAGPPATEVPTGSDVVPTASPVFTTTTVVTPYRRRKGKEVMVESDSPKKQKVQEQIDAQVAREFEEQLERKRIREGWKVKDFRGMTFEEVEAKFSSVWKQMKDFIPMGSKEEAERIKRKGLSLEQESAKKQKTSEEVTEEGKSLMKSLKRRLVKDTLSNRPPTNDKEMELWVKLSRLYEPDDEDQLWTYTQNFMHALVEWKLYDSCGVHHVTCKDKEIFMLVEKDYPLRKGLALMMISYKLQVENYSQGANDLILKIYKIANSPREQGIEFPLAEEVPTASEEDCHCQKKRDATAMKISLLLNSRRNCQSKSNDSFTKAWRETLILEEIPTITSHTYCPNSQKKMDHQYPTVANIPVLDTGKFEQWQFQIQQYLQHEHYALWEVIEFGDSYNVPINSDPVDSRRKDRRTVIVTTDDMQKKKNDVKAKTTLLLSLPDEHQLRFSKYKTAKELWAAILKTFGLGLEVGSIWRIQWIRYGVLEFLGVGTTLDIFQNIHILYLEYGVLSFSRYGILNFFPLWSLVSAGMDTPYLP
nr:hypothetical protein [Tanacetum cinerariifolium]